MLPRPGNFLVIAKAATILPTLFGRQATAAVSLAGKGLSDSFANRFSHGKADSCGQIGDENTANRDAGTSAFQKWEDAPR